jgi:predicted MPP superfamily phosphohydrolase
MKLLSLLCLTAVMFLFTPLSATTLKGYVFVDKNNNGIRDKSEAGVKDVIVSDQVTTTSTNSDGYYEFESTNNLGFIFITQPTGFAVKGFFWRNIPAGQAVFVCDFPLITLSSSTTFKFIHASDSHISEASIDRIRKLKLKADSLKVAFVIISGDLIKDALRVGEADATRLYNLYCTEIANFSVPVYSVPGNHEVFGIERHTSLVSEKHPLYGKKMYRRFLGPDYYSFNYGGVHFIGINSVDYHELWYYGHVDSVQLSWMEHDVASLSKTMPIVTFNHIPFFSGGLSMWGFQDGEPGSTLLTIDGNKIFRHVVDNTDKVLNVLRNNFYPLALSGHYHSAQQFTIENIKTRFNQTGALIGPSEVANISLPSGFTVYSVENGKIDNGKFIEVR